MSVVSTWDPGSNQQLRRLVSIVVKSCSFFRIKENRFHAPVTSEVRIRATVLKCLLLYKASPQATGITSDTWLQIRFRYFLSNDPAPSNSGSKMKYERIFLGHQLSWPSLTTPLFSHTNGLFTLPDPDSDSNLDCKLYGYIVIYRTFHIAYRWFQIPIPNAKYRNGIGIRLCEGNKSLVSCKRVCCSKR